MKFVGARPWQIQPTQYPQPIPALRSDVPFRTYLENPHGSYAILYFRPTKQWNQYPTLLKRSASALALDMAITLLSEFSQILHDNLRPDDRNLEMIDEGMVAIEQWAKTLITWPHPQDIPNEKNELRVRLRHAIPERIRAFLGLYFQEESALRRQIESVLLALELSIQEEERGRWRGPEVEEIIFFSLIALSGVVTNNNCEFESICEQKQCHVMFDEFCEPLQVETALANFDRWLQLWWAEFTKLFPINKLRYIR